MPVSWAGQRPQPGQGLRYWPYDRALRFEVPLAQARVAGKLPVPTGDGPMTILRSVGSVHLPSPVGPVAEVWWLDQYGGGIFLPLRDQHSRRHQLCGVGAPKRSSL